MWHADVIFMVEKIVLHLWAVGGKGMGLGKGKASGLWETGQLISNMGPDWRSLHHTIMATTRSKGLFCFFILRFFYVIILSPYYCIILYIFFPSAG
jgi:hypothetical protein